MFIDTDERENRVVVGVSDLGLDQAVRRLFESLRADPEAIVIVISEIPVPAISLQDKHRPTVGGVQLWHDSPTVDGNCTLGANPVRRGYFDSYFVTASHCSTVAFGPDGTLKSDWYQATAWDTLAHGEAVDPGPFTGGSCPPGKVCRWSDVTLVRYQDQSDWLGGTVAYATGAAPFVIQYYVTYDQTFSGTGDLFQSKTGRTTGTTGGTGLSWCMTFYPDSATYANVGVVIPGNLALLCQDKKNINAAAGDSGAPYFLWWSDTPEVAILLSFFHAGASGTDKWFSPLSGVEKDLGPMYWDRQ